MNLATGASKSSSVDDPMRVTWIGTAIAALVALLFALRPAPVGNLDNSVCDILTNWAGRGHLSGKVAIVEIDDASIAKLGRWPWPRDLVASLVRRILDAGAATVVLDTVFDQPSDAGKDDLLASALRGHPVVAGYAFRFEGKPSDATDCELRPLQAAIIRSESSASADFFHPIGVLCNVRVVSQAASYAGFMNAAADLDGKLRTIPLVMDYRGQLYPSLALAAFKTFLQSPDMQFRFDSRESSTLRTGSRVQPLEGRTAIRLRFRGPRRTFPYVAAASLLDSSVPSEILGGKIVILGNSALALSNPVYTSLDPQFPDVEVHATAIDNLLQGDSFHRPASLRVWELLLAFFAGVVSTILLSRRPARQSAALIVITLGCVCSGCVILASTTGYLFSPLPLTAVLASTFPAGTLLNYRREKLRAERTEAQLSSEREAAQAVLRESESRYRRLVENINDAIIVDDSRGRLVFANHRFREWFGFEGKSIDNVSLMDCVAIDWRARFNEWRARSAASEASTDRFEFEGLRADGSRIWIEALATAIAEEGRVTGTQWALRDVTARKLIEAQYLQSQKMEIVGRLAGGVAHDFNNLLQVINGYAETLLRSESMDEGHKASLQEILVAGEHASELTRKLLTFSRKEAIRPVVLNLNEVVAEAAKMCARLITEDIELVTNLTSEPGYLLADSGQIHQLLMNLLVNARDAMPRGGRIVIETGARAEARGELPGPLVYLGITDNGSGMSDEVKRHLFEPFFTTKEPGKGTGLGLATVYGVVEQSSGKIEVTSSLGQGTAVHIYFPRVPSPPRQPAVVLTTPSSNESTGTVLLVEDQENVRKFLRAVLSRSGYRVVEAVNGSDALTVAGDFIGTIDLLVTDLIMPLMNGQELAERLMVDRPNTKVLFMSGYAKETIGGRGIDMPGLVYLQKPFAPSQLIAKVREALQRPTSGQTPIPPAI
jgi:PAS domain S-box-containing protein